VAKTLQELINEVQAGFPPDENGLVDITGRVIEEIRVAKERESFDIRARQFLQAIKNGLENVQ